MLREEFRTYTKDESEIGYKLIFKKRKTMGIYIDAYGNIELRVPRTVTHEQVEQLIDSKWPWIIQKTAEMKERTKGFKEKTYEDGEECQLFGENVPVMVEFDETFAKASLAFDGETVTIQLPTQDVEVIRKLMKRFYRQQLKKKVEERIRHYQKHFKVKPRSVKINANKKHWGSCSGLRELTFNWRLAMAPIDVVDYVVIHELCHMVHLNHDRSFWRLVGSFMPDYEEKQAWLRQSHWKMVV